VKHERLSGSRESSSFAGGGIGHNGAPEDLPIPEDARPGPGWTEQMLEMADHIGAYRTLLLVDRFGGMRIYVPADPERGKSYPGKGSIRDCIGKDAAAKLSEIYRREYLSIPTARNALLRARRAPVLAKALEGEMTISEAARIVGTTRPFASQMVKELGEASEADPASERRRAERRAQFDMFGDGEA
jgi:hypothetical protein